MTAPILVTGASGNVGREVVAALRAHGLQPTAALRDPERTPDQFPEDVHRVRFDFLDPSTWAEALQGQTHLFLMRPPAIADVQNNVNPFFDAARNAGIEHIVFLSVAGADRNRFVPHRKVEDHLRRVDNRFTILRPGFFTQNLQDAYRQDIVEDDRIFVPAGTNPVNWIDVRDVATVAALIFIDPEPHRGQGYTLEGPGAVPWSEVVQSLREVLGREIRYEPASILCYILHLRRRGLTLGAVLVQTVLHVLLRFGQGERDDPTLERLLGHPARTIQSYIRDHVGVWQR